jgi:hypothetical protein
VPRPSAFLVGLGLLLAAPSAWAQGSFRQLSASPSQALDFGTIIAGVASRVSRTDAVRAGQVEVRGDANLEVRIDVALPTALRGPNGAALPLQFGADDGGYSRSPSIRSTLAFDPRAPLTTRLGPSGKLYLFFGGAALPAARQPAGTYAETVTVSITYTGN